MEALLLMKNTENFISKSHDTAQKPKPKMEAIIIRDHL